jgi:alkaline phosphatase
MRTISIFVPRFRIAFALLVTFALCALPFAGAQEIKGPPPAKNIILMVSDGAGYNAFDACSYYQYGQLGMQVYDEFPVRLACTHYMQNDDGTMQSYDPAQMWSDFNYVKGDNDYKVFTDSAAAATALNSGLKTTKGRVNTDINSTWMTTLAELADVEGMSIGAISSVEFTHATPACVWAHNDSRNNYEDIGIEMIYSSGLDVIMGAGHPLFGHNGEPVAPGTNSYKYVGGQATWDALVNGTTGQGWTLIETKADFEALANGTMSPPDRLAGVAQVYQTLQYNRDGSGMGNLITTVPTLETMTKASLNVLSLNPDGFYLMVEGGAVDWANHGNDLGRMIEEQIDFNRSVEAVVAWVEANSNWGETLLIVTSDHECGMLWGAGSYIDTNGNDFYDDGVDVSVDWMPITNNGAGNLPDYQYGSGGHTNALVPLYAKGRGANYFRKLIDGRDFGAKSFWGVIGGFYVDNTDVFETMNRVLP